jgi:hypothetical protein
MIAVATQRAGARGRVVYFNPEANVGDGATPTVDSTQDAPRSTTNVPETDPSSNTEPETKPDDKTH